VDLRSHELTKTKCCQQKKTTTSADTRSAREEIKILKKIIEKKRDAGGVDTLSTNHELTDNTCEHHKPRTPRQYERKKEKKRDTGDIDLHSTQSTNSQTIRASVHQRGT